MNLLSTFAVTDCLQLLCGNDFYVFDPCGQYLVETSSTSYSVNAIDLDSQSNEKNYNPIKNNVGPKARKYVLLKEGESDQLKSDVNIEYDKEGYEDLRKRFPYPR